MRAEYACGGSIRGKVNACGLQASLPAKKRTAAVINRRRTDGTESTRLSGSDATRVPLSLGGVEMSHVLNVAATGALWATGALSSRNAN